MRVSKSFLDRFLHTFSPSSVMTLAIVLVMPNVASGQWNQWGGPDRDFRIENAGLADSWPDSGPKVFWKRKLGEGFSSIVCDKGVLYTMYRKRTDPQEHMIALDASTGATIWEKHHASPVPTEAREYPGPHSTPIVTDSRLFGVGRNGVLRCYDKKDGRVVWSRDLAKEYGAKFSEWGYAPSPLVYKDLVIVAAGRRRPNFNTPPGGQPLPSTAGDDAAARTLMAFRIDGGGLAWKTQDLGIDHASPILVDVGGQAQVIQATPECIFGVDPDDGRLIWSKEMTTRDGCMVTPIWLSGSELFYSSPQNGSAILSLLREGDRTNTAQRWETRKLRMTFTNPVAVGNYLVGSSGGAPTLVVCLDRRSGARLWVDRRFALASFVSAGDKIIILEESGRLSLATVTADGLKVRSQHKVADPQCYTAPILAGTTLYLRNRQDIMALDLS